MTRNEVLKLLRIEPMRAVALSCSRNGCARSMIRCGLTVIIICQFGAEKAANGIETVTPDFRLSLPDGFAKAPDLMEFAPDIIGAFVLGDRSDDEADIILLVEKLGGTIGRKELDLESLPAGFNGRIFKLRWQGFDVDAFEVPETVGQISTLTYNVQIPLRRSAIQLKLVSTADRKPELERLFPLVLAGLTGESNWIPALVPFSFASSRGYGFGLLAVAILMDVGALVFFWRLSKRTPKGTVLIIAIGIYVASWLLRGVRSREVLMLTGAMRLLGVGTFIVGIIDFFRKRTCAHEPGSCEVSEEVPT